MAQTFLAAVVQAGAAVFDRARTIEKLRRLTAEAAIKGASLVLFPEAFVSGYPKELDFGARVGRRTPEGREDFRRYFESALELGGPDEAAIGRAARENKVHLVVGVMERDGGTLYCTVLFYGPDGTLLGKHRKLMPTAMERLIWGFGDGSTLAALDTPLGRLGAVICWENYMPLLRMAMYSKGVQIYCAPTADDRDTWLSTMRHVALEGRCFVLSACQYLTRADCPADYPADCAPETVLMRGGSCVVSPLGRVLAGPHFEGPAILTAEIDLAEIPRGKYDFDVVGHYARPDVFQLHVNERPMPAVVRRSDFEGG
ncbi:MAG: carbon-nitrogen hydrolase family protein [Candidatus Tectomicrobia bacterium]|uniref:Carbon-nitrogen hydrolase family protein n=1 Tax=Tectimicrobiota bacterium TaxID=2528274 RepID=A0A932I304_UNCTE|nr:carbon-nitrogen hydrolase family protein [Candidatus Tectomicrobia bacterium]